MKLISLATIAASVLSSVMVTLLVVPHSVAGSSGVFHGRGIELTDAKGDVRIKMSITSIGGVDRPEVTILGQDGRPAVLLALNERDQGTLYINSRETEGKVALGYIWGSDVPLKGEDPLALWGVRVLGRNGQVEALGIGTDGRPILPLK